MRKIRLDREYVESSFLRYIDLLLELPEVEGVKLGNALIRNNEHKKAAVHKAFDCSYHDRYSDSDITVIVDLPSGGSVTPSDYVKHPARFGITPDQYLGFFRTSDSGIYRVAFRDGTRYDMGFEFRYSDTFPPFELMPEPERCSNPGWPIEKVDEFWFIMLQALGKLYRHDYLISSHLANICINETLVQQMVFRDMERGTTHHRYGYREKLIYQQYEGQNSFVTGDGAFDRIADKLYAAALAYDELTKGFYPEYEARSNVLFDIWQCYNESENS